MTNLRSLAEARGFTFTADDKDSIILARVMVNLFKTMKLDMETGDLVAIGPIYATALEFAPKLTATEFNSILNVLIDAGACVRVSDEQVEVA